MRKRQTYRDRHAEEGYPTDPFCGECGTDWPCEPAILIRVVDAAAGMDRPRQGDPQWMWDLAAEVERARRLVDG